MNIYEYRHYTEVLRAFHELKSAHPKWSLGLWARKSGLSSSSVLSNILAGRKIPSLSLHKKFSEFLILSVSEKQYFDLLFARAREKDVDEQRLLDRKIAHLLKLHQVSVLSLPQFEMISSPLAYALIELTKLALPLDLEEFAARSVVSFPLSDVKAVWALLEEQGWVFQDTASASGYSCREQVFDLPSDFQAEVIRRFHQQSGSCAMVALEVIPKKDRYFGSNLMAIRASDFSKLQKELDAFRKKILVKYSDTQSLDKVVQVNLQLFPHFSKTD